MIEKQSINGKEVWVRVNPYRLKRSSSNIIPTEYFTADYFFNEPEKEDLRGETISDEDGQIKLFESPVEALSFATKKLQKIL